MADNTTIILTVDTANITEATKNDNVVFSDDVPSDIGESPGDPANYVSTVKKKMKVIWAGVDENGGKVVIKKVEKKGTNGGDDILENIKAKDGNYEAKIKDSDATLMESYNIKITVDSIDYTIDPKIQMNPIRT